MLLKNEIIYYKVEGFNFDKFLKEAKKLNLKLHSLKREQKSVFYVGVILVQNKLFLNICDKLNLKLKRVSQTKALGFLCRIKKNLLYLLCSIFILLSLGIASNIVFKIEVIGTQTLKENQIVSALNENGIDTGRFKWSYDLDSVENILKNSIEKVSLATAVIRGNTLIVSVNEKIDNSQYVYDYEPIIAPYDMVIKEIKLKSGTAVKKQNQTVKKGEAIVLPYIEYKDGTQLSVEAEAEILAQIELSTTYYYMENHTEEVLSGKSYQVVEYSLFGKSWLGGKNKQNGVPFSNYKKNINTSYIFTNLFIPLKKTTINYCELMPKQVFRAFTPQIEQNLIEENKKVLYNKLSDRTKVGDIDFMTTINFSENMYLVTTYLKANIVI